MKRAHISLKTKLASAICALLKIPHDHAKLMTEDQVLSLAHWHHNILHAHGGPDTHWNIEPKAILAHRDHTSKVDRPAADRTRRLTESQIAIQRAITKPCGQKREKTGSIPTRGFSKGRGFDRRPRP